MDRTRKRDGRTDGQTVRLLYASQKSFGGIKIMNLQFGIFITEKDFYSLHCRKIPDEDLLLTVYIIIKIYLSYQLL